MQKLPVVAILISLSSLAPAVQAQVQRMRASIRGGSEGRCVFEVDVDGTAEVEIHGDMGVLRTLQSRPAVWRRLECSQPLPNNPGDFRFNSTSGRGRQSATRDPRDSGGVAVIRIEDPQGGSDVYAGEILWNGGDSHWGGGGNWSGGGNGWNDPWQSNNNRGIDYKAAVAVCRNQVSRVRNVPANSVAVERNGGSGMSARGYELRFRATGTYGQGIEGQCTVTTTGRLLNFNISGGGYNDRISAGNAMSICEEEVARRLQVGSGNVRVQHGNDPGNGSYAINWQGRRANGTIGTGQCIVSAQGTITDFRKW